MKYRYWEVKTYWGQKDGWGTSWKKIEDKEKREKLALTKWMKKRRQKQSSTHTQQLACNLNWESNAIMTQSVLNTRTTYMIMQQQMGSQMEGWRSAMGYHIKEMDKPCQQWAHRMIISHFRRTEEGIDNVWVVTLEHDLNATMTPAIDPEAFHKVFKVASWNVWRINWVQGWKS